MDTKNVKITKKATVIFLYNQYIIVCMEHGHLANTVFAFGSQQ